MKSTVLITDKEALRRRAVKSIFLLLAAGMIFILLDSLSWLQSNQISLKNGDDGLYFMRPAAGSDSGHLTLSAEIETDSGSYRKNFDITVKPVSTDSETEASGSEDDESDSPGKMSTDELAAYEVRSLVSSLNDDTSVQRVQLPSKLSSGEKIRWKSERRTNAAPIAFAVIVLCILIYRNRFAPLKKLRQAEQDSITRQLPEFVNRLVLLLNAGLVLNSAFEKTIEESRSMPDNENDYFYGRMREIYTKIKQTNSSMHNEFREFAKSRRSSGDDTSRELMRISNIISDNISKGVELTEKLQHESETLWVNRKRSCEERGRIAETRLTMPLTVFLLVLIAITISPALLEL